MGWTQGCLFRLSKRPLEVLPKISLLKSPISFSSSVRYLGVTLSDNLHFSEHAHNVGMVTRRMLAAFRRQFGRYTPAETLQKGYIGCIPPKLDYGVCGRDPIRENCIKSIERSQNLAARKVLNDWTTPYNQALVTLQWSSFAGRQKHLKLLQFYKYYHGIQAFPNRRFVTVAERAKG
jgi:hypothetical protein